MKRAWTSFPSLLALLALAVSLIACGGGGSGLVNDLGTDTDKGAAFSTVRYNDAGYADSALDRTVGLRTEASGDTTVVAIAISDIFEMYGVTMDLKYDATRYNPVGVEFSGLIDTPIELAVTRISGLVSVGQVDTAGTAMRDGDFAMVTFRNEPNPVSRNVSATMTDVMDEATYAPDALTVAGATGWEVTDDGAAATDTYKAWAVWAMGDGNSDGLIGIQDLTPLSSFDFWGDLISDTNLENASVDYNGDGATNITDLTRLGQNFGELATALEIYLLDSDTFDDTGAPFATLEWIAGSSWPTDPAPLPPAEGTTSWDNIFRNWSGNVTPADKIAADVNADGDVWLFARVVNTSDNGPATTAAHMSATTVVPGVIITDMVVGVGGADYEDGDLVSAEANAELVLEVTGLYGSFEGTDFTPADAGTLIPQATYDEAVTGADDATDWGAQNAGHADMRSTAPVLTIVDGTATVFPDDDPESDAGTPEGGLTATLPEASTGATAGDVVVQVDVDVTADPAAPLHKAFGSTAGADGDNFLIDPLFTTGIDYFFDYNGGVLPAPEDAVVELYDFTDGVTAYTFTYVADPLPEDPGDFAIRDNLDPESEFIVTALLSPGVAAAGHEYALRLQINPYASVNNPGGFLVMGDYPLPVDFNRVPTDAILNANNDHVWLFYPDPVIRVNPRAEWDAFNEEVVYENWDQYIDVIKASGSEFWMEDNWTHPRVTVVKDAVPSGIGIADENEAGVFTLYRCPGYLVTDIGALTFVDMGTEDYNFAYRVFAVGAPLGGGTFDVTHMAQPPFAPVGINWGINIFTDVMRGDAEDIDDRDYSNHILDGNSVTATGEGQPDVLFVEYAGGDAYTFPLDAGYGAWGNNMRINFHSDAEGADWAVPWDPRAVTSTGNMIAIHAFIAQDFDKPGDVTYGHFDSPQTDWQIQLTNAAGQVEFDFGTDVADVMSVVGPNPND